MYTACTSYIMLTHLEKIEPIIAAAQLWCPTHGLVGYYGYMYVYNATCRCSRTKASCCSLDGMNSPDVFHLQRILGTKTFHCRQPPTPPPHTHIHTSFCCGPGYTVSVFTHNVCFPFEVEPGYCITHGCHTVQMQVCMYIYTVGVQY